MSMSYSRNGITPNRLIASLYAKKNILDAAMEKAAYDGAMEIMQRSISYTPVDEGHLEEAHHIVERSTRKGNAAFDVEVSGNESDLYADWIHEGPYNLGPLSQAKAAFNGQNVGPRFLERAFDETRPKIINEFRQIVKEFAGK